MRVVTPRIAVVLSLATFALVAGTTSAGAQTVSSGSPRGNVTPSTQPASGVAVVAQSAPVDGRVALLVHNAKSHPVRVVRITAVATSADGGHAIRARSLKAYPQLLAPDALALASVTFRADALTPTSEITAKVRSRRVSTARARRVLTVSDLVLSPPMTGAVAQTLEATVTNPTSSWTAYYPQVGVMCFGEASTPTTFTAARVVVRRISPGKSKSATVRLTSLCPAYLVAARTP